MVTRIQAEDLAPAQVRSIVADVPDPEIPVVSIEDLGILRDVEVRDGGHVVVRITPTYSGCPAMDAIRADVLRRLADHGIADAEVETVWAPAWSTDWISAEGRAALRAYGIAPPGPTTPRTTTVALALTVRCPRCGSPDTREVSRFGSTACKSHWVCGACHEPFDHMKAI
jgi:ring-1,2-phenylacetyl-CoA epoxidase subunit PaaD